MTPTDNWLPPHFEEERLEGGFGTYQFNWGVASLDFDNARWIQIIEFKDQMEHLVDYYPMGTTFHVHPEGFRIDIPSVTLFDPVELNTPLQ